MCQFDLFSTFELPNMDVVKTSRYQYDDHSLEWPDDTRLNVLPMRKSLVSVQEDPFVNASMTRE